MIPHVIIRPATEDDLPEINRILNDVIAAYTYNVSHRAKTMDDTRRWFDEHRNSDRYKIFTALSEGDFVGWVSLSSFRASEGYDTTAELSVYIAPRYQGKGVGDFLMSEIERYAKEAGHIHCIMSVITADNEVSIRLHEKHHYKTEGVFKEIAFKNGKYIDIIMMTKLI